MAAARGEVVGADHAWPPLDPAPAADMVGRGEVGDAALLVIAGEPGQAADLAEAAVVEQKIDPLAAGELAAITLTHHAGIGRAGCEAGVGDGL